jgi:hypothetical protein
VETDTRRWTNRENGTIETEENDKQKDRHITTFKQKDREMTTDNRKAETIQQINRKTKENDR